MITSQNVLGAAAFFPSITDDGAFVTIAPTNQFYVSVNTEQFVMSGNNTFFDGNNMSIQNINLTMANTPMGQPTRTINFYSNNVGTPQQTAIAAPTGGLIEDTEARTAINELITKLVTLNLIAL